MSNPHAPPSTQDTPQAASSNNHTTLRCIGALALTYSLTKLLWRFSNLRNALGILDIFVGSAFLSLLIFGFIRGRRTFHFWIALFMLLSISAQTYFMDRALAHPERLRMDPGAHPWLHFAFSLLPHTIALICAIALFIRADRSTPPPDKSHHPA